MRACINTFDPPPMHPVGRCVPEINARPRPPREMVTEIGDVFDMTCPACFNPLREHARIKDGTPAYNPYGPPHNPRLPVPGTIVQCPDVTPLGRIPPR